MLRRGSSKVIIAMNPEGDTESITGVVRGSLLVIQPARLKVKTDMRTHIHIRMDMRSWMKVEKGTKSLEGGEKKGLVNIRWTMTNG